MSENSPHLGETDATVVATIFKNWHDRLDGEVQGACAAIAMEIYFCLDCKDEAVVGGYLTSSTGWKRAHWWIEKNGITYDPMGDEYKGEPGFKRVVEHRGQWDRFVEEYRRQKGNIPPSPYHRGCL